MQIIAKSEIESQAASRLPFVLGEKTDIRIFLVLRFRAERLLKLAVSSRKEICEIRKCVNALYRPGKADVQIVIDILDPAFY